MRTAAFSGLVSRRTLRRSTRAASFATFALPGRQVSAAGGAVEHLSRGNWQEQQKFNCQRCLSTNPALTHSPKAWLDKTRSLPSRVKALMDTPKIHPAEICNRDSDLEKLLIECCKLQSLEGMQLAQEIMERVTVEKGRYRDEQIDVFIPVTLWEKVLFGWAKLAKKQAIALERMRDLMDTIIEEATADEKSWKGTETPSETPPSQPTVYVFNTFLDGLAEAAFLAQGAALIAESTIFNMKDLHAKKDWHTKPNARSYTFAIQAHANSWHPKSDVNAVNILRHVRSEHKIEAAVYKRKHGVDYDENKLSATTPKIVAVDATMYTVTMNAVLRSGRSYDLVLELLNQATKDGVVDGILYNLGIKALAQKIENTKNPARRLAIAEQAESYLNKAMDCQENSKLAPTSSLNACLDVWARSFLSEMGPRSEELLNKMIGGGSMPDCVTFHGILRAWTKGKKFYGEQAISRVEATLQFQKSLAEQSNGSVEYPDYQAYALAILAYVGQGKDSIPKVADLLDEMLMEKRERRFTTTSGNPCAPFTSLLSVTASVPKEGSPPPDDSLLWSDSRFSDPYELANVVYEHVIGNVYEIDNLVADHHFYAAFLRNILAHGNPKAVDFETTAVRVWEHACEAGQVSRLLWPLAAKIPALQKTLPTPMTKTLALPRLWWREVEPRWR